MRRAILLVIAVAMGVITPVIAQDQNPVITNANQRKAEAEALKAQYDAQKSLAESRLAPLSQFAGEGENKVSNKGGEMEAAYLAAVVVRPIADRINASVDAALARATHGARSATTDARSDRGGAEDDADVGETEIPVENTDDEFTIGDGGGVDTPQPRTAAALGNARAPVILLAGTETVSFDLYTAFELEADGIILESVAALRTQGSTCPVPSRPTRGSEFVAVIGPGTLATIGTVIGLLQSDMEVIGIETGTDAAMLVNALGAGREGHYVRPDELLMTTEARRQPVLTKLGEIRNCELALLAELDRNSGQNQTDAQKRRVQEVTPVIQHITSFNTRLRTPGNDGKSVISSVLRQSVWNATTSRYVLRVAMNRAGGTMIIRKNLWTALGAPAIILSGGVIANYSLTDRNTGRLMTGGTVICRTGLTGLRSALELRHGDVRCADANDNHVSVNGQPRRPPRPSRLEYDDAVFRREGPR